MGMLKLLFNKCLGKCYFLSILCGETNPWLNHFYTSICSFLCLLFLSDFPQIPQFLQMWTVSVWLFNCVLVCSVVMCFFRSLGVWNFFWQSLHLSSKAWSSLLEENLSLIFLGPIFLWELLILERVGISGGSSFLRSLDFLSSRPFWSFTILYSRTCSSGAASSGPFVSDARSFSGKGSGSFKLTEDEVKRLRANKKSSNNQTLMESFFLSDNNSGRNEISCDESLSETEEEDLKKSRRLSESFVMLENIPAETLMSSSSPSLRRSIRGKRTRPQPITKRLLAVSRVWWWWVDPGYFYPGVNSALPNSALIQINSAQPLTSTPTSSTGRDRLGLNIKE